MLEDLQSIEPRISAEVFKVLGVENSVASRTSYGGASPDNVRKAAQSWIDCLGVRT
jgi:argininosuccinate lyase